MNRRAVVAFLGTAAVLGPFAANAQAPGRKPVIGVLGVSTAANWAQWTAAFLQRLTELGWVDGSTVAIEYRWADGRTERFAEIAAEFVRLNVDVILTVGTGVTAAKQATSSIPIVFAIAVDPVGSGMVQSLARPGGNATGFSTQTTELAGKRLEILRELVPEVKRVAVIGNAGYAGAVLEFDEVKRAAGKLGIAVDVLGIRRAEDIQPAFTSLSRDVRALYVSPDGLVNANQTRINEFALARRLPTMHPFREYLESGGLVSYGASNTEMFRRAADYVDRILKGTKPLDLPIEQPTKFELIVNLKTAKALGFTIPAPFLLRADEVIE